MRSLYDQTGKRKYLTPAEQQRFIAVLAYLTPSEALLCRTLLTTGCRLSEALALQWHHVHAEEQCLLIRSLKKRGAMMYRRVPISRSLLADLLKLAGAPDAPLWPLGRTAGWACVKRAMQMANIEGPQACPRGLRHTFGVHAIQNGVPLNLVQRWLGHARMETTAIYADIIGLEEIEMARRMW